MAEPRYLIGGGEQLASEIPRAKRAPSEKAHPYTFTDARTRLAPQWRSTSAQLSHVPPLALPDGEAVIALTLHPTYLAKSYYPRHLLRELNLRHVGSRAVHLTPERSTYATKKKQSEIKDFPAPQLFVAATVDQLADFSDMVSDWLPTDDVRQEFRQIEYISTLDEDRLKPIPEEYQTGRKLIPLEVVLHASPSTEDDYIKAGFAKYAKSLGVEVDLQDRRHAGGLCFLPLRARYEALEGLLNFSFLRALRVMPRLVQFDPFVRSLVPGFNVTVPTDDALAPGVRAAIFDGGLPKNHGLDRWVTLKEATDVGAAIPKAQTHGLAVTSAFLFGPLDPTAQIQSPYANVDHWRVIGANTIKSDFEMYAVLDCIEDILGTQHYDFVNISLGPAAAMEDDDVNRWTSTLDTLFADGETVATVACGNNGESDSTLRLNRVQPPSDGVNVVAVGASDQHSTKWQRASYSAVGPGRSPGYVKPDLVTFGGSHAAPFLVLNGNASTGAGTMGTSFAAPLCMRSGAGVRAQFREVLWAPTIKALLIHHAHPANHSRAEVGWGRISHDLADLVLCDDYEAHIIYQRQMPLTGTVRLYLPMPPDLRGDTKIKATFCFFCQIDPEDSLNYTRAGLDIQFRPNTTIKGKPYLRDGQLVTPATPPSDSFFGAGDFYSTEVERRKDAQKWETVLSAEKTKRSSSLNQPAFDVSYLSREHGHDGGRVPMKFALILTLENKHAADLYERILTSYRTRLQPLRPRQRVPVRV